MRQSGRVMMHDVLGRQRFGRREFAAGACAWLLATSRFAVDGVAEDELHVLNPGDYERLRMDFNASRAKVRLFSVLSPT